VSKYHFARCFEAAYGETPIRYLTRRRIERAQDLLRVANLTVTEVCMAVGFSSLGSFSTRFAALVGESPPHTGTAGRPRGDHAYPAATSS
jgi:transcriptional regulator GlxA family with amidase domain